MVSRNRSSDRRLAFESLESKASLTSVAFPDAAGLSPQTAEVECITDSRADRLLSYVAGWEEISVDRSLPAPVDVQAADELMTENAPTSD